MESRDKAPDPGVSPMKLRAFWQPSANSSAAASGNARL